MHNATRLFLILVVEGAFARICHQKLWFVLIPTSLTGHESCEGLLCSPHLVNILPFILPMSFSKQEQIPPKNHHKLLETLIIFHSSDFVIIFLKIHFFRPLLLNGTN